MRNINLVKLILDILGKPYSLIQHVTDRPGHDRRYAIDASLIRRELGWTPQMSFATALRQTVDWYQAHPDWVSRVRSGAYKRYYE
jgi:dTDP-glucose 4,6-dehydratase